MIPQGITDADERKGLLDQPRAPILAFRQRTGSRSMPEKPLPPALARSLAAAQWPTARAHVLTNGFIPWRNPRARPRDRLRMPAAEGSRGIFRAGQEPGAADAGSIG